MSLKRSMNHWRIGLACVALLVMCAPLQTEAQIWKNLSKKLEEKIENEASKRAERKIDQAINKSFDKLEKSAEGAFSGGQFDQNQLDAIIGAMGADVTLKDTYDFGVGVTYETSVSDGSKNGDRSTMTMWFSDHPYIGMEATDGKERMFTVLDEGQVVIFMEEQKSYMAIGSAMFEAMGTMAEKHIEEAGEEPGEEFTFKRLPDETILGQRCKVYQAKSAEAESRIWYTEALGVDMLKGFAKSLSTLTRQDLTQTVPTGMEGVAGVMMKMESKTLDSNETITMEAKTIHRDGTKIKSANYKRAGL